MRWYESVIGLDSGMLRPRISEIFARDEQNLHETIRLQDVNSVTGTLKKN